MAANVIAPHKANTDLSITKAKEIMALHKAANAAFLKGAKLAFQAGALLSEIKLRTDTYQWKDWITDVLKLSLVTVNRYIALYETFKENPEELESLTMKEAIHKAALEFCAKKSGETKGKAVYGGDPNKQPELDWEEAFSKPPVSKAKLKNYRFECFAHRSLWLVKRGMNFPVKFMDLFTERPKDELALPYDAMMKAIQASVELYFEQVERMEG